MNTTLEQRENEFFEYIFDNDTEGARFMLRANPELLNAIFYPTTGNIDEMSPIFIASLFEQPEMLEMLLEEAHGNALADINNTFYSLIFNHSWITYPQGIDPQIIHILLKHGADINQRHRMRQITPLMMLCSIRDLEGVEVLLSEGADVNATNPHGVSALGYALGDYEQDEINNDVVELVLAWGLIPTQKDLDILEELDEEGLIPPELRRIINDEERNEVLEQIFDNLEKTSNLVDRRNLMNLIKKGYTARR
jgi:ankyrin repeat protein